MTTALLTGFGLGFLVAAQVGPIWLLCARTALRGGLAGALGVGLGAAIVDTAYASLGVAGAPPPPPPPRLPPPGGGGPRPPAPAAWPPPRRRPGRRRGAPVPGGRDALVGGANPRRR